jgi:very-short-patch-repair endonuclease
MKSKLTPVARRLRRTSTDAERQLWERLRDRQLAGRKFRRQVLIGPYVADFACIDEPLVIELDGGQHAENQDDQRRTADIEVRFWNNEVLHNTDGVLVVISSALLRPEPSPCPFPKGRGNDGCEA